MAQNGQSTDRKRVKVYELRNNDWFDRGTGFCTAAFVPMEEGSQAKDPRVIVESEEQPDRILLETKISKEDMFSKQQETLIVWTEPSNNVDMALSFQEPEGCTMIWKFVEGVQQSFRTAMGGAEDSISEDLGMELSHTVISLPTAELRNLQELEGNVRVLSQSAAGRDSLAKTIMSDEYITKLIPVFEMAEDLESLADLHRLCNIMKTVLLLNDTSIIEQAMSDECILGVVGALEYDPDFPSHKANHRQWLNNQGRYKEVVRIEDDQIRKKIHQTYRLQYLKDVVLARILDDPTFSVLNSLIFFNQVDIVQHLQSNGGFLGDLFGIFADPKELQLRKKEAVLFIQQCCAIAKNLQPPARQTLYNNFLAHGLLHVINFGLRNHDVSVRVGATDILVSMIDHDPQLIRQTIYRQMSEQELPLTDTLIELLLVEVDLGVKSQISDALKLLLDPNPPGQPPENFAKAANGEFVPRVRPQQAVLDPQHDIFLASFYEKSAVKLFKPLLDLEHRTDMTFSVLDDGIFSYLNEILCFYVRQHNHRSKYFVLKHNVALRFGQLLQCREKHLQLVAIRFFHQLIILQDEFYIRHLCEKHVLGPILDVLLRTMPRDNLLCSACLALFEFIKKESIKELIKHLVENYREKIMALSYLELFRTILGQYDQTQGFMTNVDPYFLDGEDEGVRRPTNVGARGLMEHLPVDPVEEEYWNTSDDEDENHLKGIPDHPTAKGGSARSTPKLLVEYTSDSDGDEVTDSEMAIVTSAGIEEQGRDDSQGPSEASDTIGSSTVGENSPAAATPPERVSEKRRREEDEDDEMGKLLHNKRRNSTSASMNSANSAANGISLASLRRKRNVSGARADTGISAAPKKINISLASPAKEATTSTTAEHDDR